MIFKQEMDLEMIRYRIQSIEPDNKHESPLQMLITIIDTKDRGYLNKEKLSDFLVEKSNYFASEREIGHIMSRFDQKK